MGVIVFLGDSITDAGRTTSCPPLGNGYVKGFADSVSQNWNVLNQGVDGYITERIAEDLHKDCIAFHPNYVSILVGINDVGQQSMENCICWKTVFVLITKCYLIYPERRRQKSSHWSRLFSQKMENMKIGCLGRKRCQRILENWRVITTQDLFRFKNLLIARLKDWDMMPSPQIVFI